MWKKYSRAGEAIDDNMAQALFTLGTKGHKYTLTEYVIPFALPPAAIVARTRLNVTLYVHCLSCNIYVSSMPVSSKLSYPWRFATK